MPGTILTRGNVTSLTAIAVALTPLVTAANSVTEQNFTIVGLLPNDIVIGWSVNFAFTSSLVINNIRVSARDTMTISFANQTAGALTFPSGQWLLVVTRPELPVTSLPANAV